MQAQWSFRLKICVLFTSLLGCFLIVYSGVLYYILSVTLNSEMDHELVIRAISIAESTRVYLDQPGRQGLNFLQSLKINIRNREKIIAPEHLAGSIPGQSQHLDHYHQINDYIFARTLHSSDHVSSSGLPRDVLASMSAIAEDNSRKFFDRRLNGQMIRFYRSSELMIPGEPVVMVIGTSLEPMLSTLKKCLTIIILGIGLMLVLALFVSHFLAAQIVQPILAVANTARNITQDNLEARVSTRDMDPDMMFLAESFNDMIQRLETSFRFIREFALDVTHELKTPLAIIRGETEVALSKDQREDYRTVMQSTLVELDRMLRIIQDLFQITQQDLAIEGLDFQTLDITGLLKEVAMNFQTVVKKRKIQVELELPARPVRVLGDEIQLRRMLLNLADNAGKALADGGEMGFRCREEGTRVIITVWDHGVGIPPEHLPRIFQKFYRVIRAGRANKRPGHGLGLSMVQAIIKNHQGTILVHSMPGQGTEFTITLPCFMPGS